MPMKTLLAAGGGVEEFRFHEGGATGCRDVEPVLHALHDDEHDVYLIQSCAPPPWSCQAVASSSSGPGPGAAFASSSSSSPSHDALSVAPPGGLLVPEGIGAGAGDDADNNNCCICLTVLWTDPEASPVTLLPCDHQMHDDCLTGLVRVQVESIISGRAPATNGYGASALPPLPRDCATYCMHSARRWNGGCWLCLASHGCTLDLSCAAYCIGTTRAACATKLPVRKAAVWPRCPHRRQRAV